MGRIKANLSSRVKKGKMSQAAADAAFGKVKGTLDYSDFGEHYVPVGCGISHLHCRCTTVNKHWLQLWLALECVDSQYYKPASPYVLTAYAPTCARPMPDQCQPG